MQVESFMLLLLQLTLPALKANAHLHIVEFGSGSGNLVLPLAHLFPCFTFTAVDMKASAIALLGSVCSSARCTMCVCGRAPLSCTAVSATYI